jgi:hypothetical protein
LLELLLALSLTVVVLALVNMAVDVHLRSLDTRRNQLEEAQLARSILRMIADDLRGTIQHYEQDTSEVEALLQQSVASAAGSLGDAAAALGAAAGASSGGGDSGGSGSGSSGGSSSGGSSNGGSSGGGLSSGGTSGSGSSGGSSASSATGDAGSASADSQYTQDLATGVIPPVPGLFGNQYQLQIDVSRLPRIENYQQVVTPDMATGVVDIPSDVKTVTYYVQSAPVVGDTLGIATSGSLDSLLDPANGVGLVRRELDRSVTQWAMENGNYLGLQNNGDLVAPEVVAIEFQYFDGTQWLTAWDSDLEKKLPLAVLVILAMRTPGSEMEIPTAAALSTATAEDQQLLGLHLYRQLVWLPVGGQTLTEESGSSSESGDLGSGAASSDGGSAGSSSDSSSGGSSGSGVSSGGGFGGTGRGGTPGGGQGGSGGNRGSGTGSGGGPGAGGPGRGGTNGGGPSGGQAGGRPGGGAPGGGAPGEGRGSNDDQRGGGTRGGR